MIQRFSRQLDAAAERLAGALPSDRPGFAFMPPAVATVFVDNLLFVLSALEWTGMTYIVHYGTLLGAHRLGGVAPWDEDADLFLLGEGLDSAQEKLGDLLSDHGFDMILDEGGFYWIRQRHWYAAQGTIGLTLFPPLVEPGERTETTWPAALSTEELHPLRRYPFYSSYVWGPGDPEVILRRLYGDTGSSEIMSRFRAPRIQSASLAFWERARPRDGKLDWTAISKRFARRSEWSHLSSLPWFWLNGAYNHHLLGRVRAVGRGLRRLTRPSHGGKPS